MAKLPKAGRKQRLEGHALEEKPRNSCSPALPRAPLGNVSPQWRAASELLLWKGRWWLLGYKCKSPPSTRQRRKQSLGLMWGLRAVPTPWLSFPAGDLGSAQGGWGEQPAAVCAWARRGLVCSPLRLCQWCPHSMPTLARTALSAKEQMLARRFHPRNPVRSQWACSKWDFILLLL